MTEIKDTDSPRLNLIIDTYVYIHTVYVECFVEGLAASLCNNITKISIGYKDI